MAMETPFGKEGDEADPGLSRPRLWGLFLARSMTPFLLAFGALFFMLLLLQPLFYIDPRERLVSVEGYFSALTYIPGKTDRDGVIEFSIREKPGVVWVAVGIRPVDQMLFVAREKQGMFVQLEVVGREFERIPPAGVPEGSEIRITPAGLRTPQNVYITPGNAAQEAGFNRKAALVGELVLGLVLGVWLVPRLRSRWRVSLEGKSELTAKSLDPVWEFWVERPRIALLIATGVGGFLLLVVLPWGWGVGAVLAWGGALGFISFRLSRAGVFSEWLGILQQVRVADREAHARKPVEKADRRHVQAVEQLLKQAGGNVNLQDSQGRTPLWIAAKTGSLEAVELLLARGADPGLADAVEGLTPMMLAARQGSLGMVIKLLARGADVLLVDINKQRALDHARTAGSKAQALIELLEAETRKAEIVLRQKLARAAEREPKSGG